MSRMKGAMWNIWSHQKGLVHLCGGGKASDRCLCCMMLGLCLLGSANLVWCFKILSANLLTLLSLRGGIYVSSLWIWANPSEQLTSWVWQKWYPVTERWYSCYLVGYTAMNSRNTWWGCQTQAYHPKERTHWLKRSISPWETKWLGTKRKVKVWELSGLRRQVEVKGTNKSQSQAENRSDCRVQALRVKLWTIQVYVVQDWAGESQMAQKGAHDLRSLVDPDIYSVKREKEESRTAYLL